MSAAVAAWTAAYGLEILFVAVALESVGVPVPGESSLIAAGVLASRGDLQMSGVVAVAATAAIVGDNVGYVLGRWGGRRLLDRWGPLRRCGPRVLPKTERFFARYGGAAVFLGRFITGIRVAAAWMAGCRACRGGAFCSGTRWARSPGPPSWPWPATSSARRRALRCRISASLLRPSPRSDRPTAHR